MPCPIISRLEMQTLKSQCKPLKMNTTTIKDLLTNGTTMTHHIRHIFIPINETIKEYFISCKNLLNVTIQSHPIKMDCCNANEKCLIVTTINPIWHSHPVHCGKKILVLIHNFIAVMQGKHHLCTQFILETKHKQSNTLSCITIEYIFLHKEIRYFILLAINTHIDCSNNSKSVFGAFSKQQQGALKVCLSAFSVIKIGRDMFVLKP